MGSSSEPAVAVEVQDARNDEPITNHELEAPTPPCNPSKEELERRRRHRIRCQVTAFREGKKAEREMKQAEREQVAEREKLARSKDVHVWRLRGEQLKKRIAEFYDKVREDDKAEKYVS